MKTNQLLTSLQEYATSDGRYPTSTSRQGCKPYAVLRCSPWTQAQTPFANSVLLSCTSTLKDRSMSVILNSACVCAYTSRKCVQKWPTRKKDIWVKCSLHLVNHMKVSFWRTLCIKTYWGKCFVQKQYVHIKCENKSSRLTRKIHHLPRYLCKLLSVHFLHTRTVFSNLWWMLNKMRVIPWHVRVVRRLNYLFVRSKFNVSTERVKRSRATDINMGSVVGLKNPDKIGTFRLLGKEGERLIFMFILLFHIIRCTRL